MTITHQQRTKLSNDLRKISARIDKMLKQSTGNPMAFSLIVWGTFGEDNMIQYVANANREDCIKNMLALIEGWMGGMPDFPYHKRQ